MYKDIIFPTRARVVQEKNTAQKYQQDEIRMSKKQTSLYSHCCNDADSFGRGYIEGQLGEKANAEGFSNLVHAWMGNVVSASKITASTYNGLHNSKNKLSAPLQTLMLH